MNFNITADRTQLRVGVEQERYLRVRVEAPASLGRERPRASVVFLVDTSKSMEATLHQVKDALAKTLRRLEPDDEFAVITFSNSPVALGPLRVAEAATIDEVVARVEGLESGGQTNIFFAWEEARDLLVGARHQIKRIILVTDGSVTRGRHGYAEVAKARLKGVVTYAIGIGNGGDAEYLHDLAEEGRGGFTPVSLEALGSQALEDALFLPIDIGVPVARLWLNLTDNVHLESFSNYPIRREGASIRVHLGSLSASQVLDSLFSLRVAPLAVYEEVHIDARLEGSGTNLLEALTFSAQFGDPELESLDTLVAALRLEANRLQLHARSLGKEKKFDEAREELLAWAKTLDEFPQHPELTHLRLMIEQEATYYRPANEHFKKERGDR